MSDLITEDVKNEGCDQDEGEDSIIETALCKKAKKIQMLTRLLEEDLTCLSDCEPSEFSDKCKELSFSDLKLISKNLKKSYTGKEVTKIFSRDFKILQNNSSQLLQVFEDFKVPKNKQAALKFLQELKAIDQGRAFRVLAKYIN